MYFLNHCTLLLSAFHLNPGCVFKQRPFKCCNLKNNNQEHFQTNSAIYSVNTRNKKQLHRSLANLLHFQNSAYYAGIKIFSSLGSSLTSYI
jgi:hypothetical protein